MTQVWIKKGTLKMLILQTFKFSSNRRICSCLGDYVYHKECSGTHNYGIIIAKLDLNPDGAETNKLKHMYVIETSRGQMMNENVLLFFNRYAPLVWGSDIFVN